MRMRRERIRRAVASVRYFLRIPRRNGPLRLENMQQPQALIQLNPTPPATAGGGASNNAQQAAEQDDILDEITADKAVDSTDSGQALNQSTTNANASTGLDEGQAPPSNADPPPPTRSQRWKDRFSRHILRREGRDGS